MNRFPAPARILVVALRRLGDVLLTTPLIRSLKRAHPDAAIDVLVFSGTEGILSGNPDIANVMTMPERPGAGETFALLGKLWRRYDLAISTQTGDRPTFYAWAAGRRSAGFVEGEGALPRLKRFALTYPVEIVANTHRVPEVLRLADALGVALVAELVAPRAAASPGAASARPYAVIHAAPMYRYKRWTDEGWRGLAGALAARGLAVVATGGPGDKGELDTIWAARPEVKRLDGVLSWPELAALIGGASVYVGPDTSVTHLAAATGVPMVALYGPTDPRLWGPWPAGGLDTPWDAAGTIQARGSVWLVQNPLPCLPCQQEGCLRRRDSHSQCLDELSLPQVLKAVDAALADPAGRRSA
jgi:lipopolysaccharide heptosyltransferase III